MHAPGEAACLIAMKVAIDKIARKASVESDELIILNDPTIDLASTESLFSRRQFVKCLSNEAEIFGLQQHSPLPSS